MYTEGPYIHPSEVIKHHAPLTPTPRSTQSTGLFKRAVYSKELQLQTVRGAFYRAVFRGKGATATANFRAI